MKFTPLLALLLWIAPNGVTRSFAQAEKGSPTLATASIQANAAEADPAKLSPAETPQQVSEEAREELLKTLREAHPWASWEPGAWRRVRVVTEAFDAERNAVGRSVTERLERLLARNETTYEIEVEAVSQLSGRPTPAPVETRKLWIATNRPVDLGEPAFYAEPASSISLGGVMSPCRVWRIEQPKAAGKREELLYLSEQGSPSLLRREFSTTDESGGGARLVETVTAAGTPVLYGDSLLDGWRRVTVVTRPGGRKSQSISVHSAGVPGGLHRESLAEYDERGHCVRWSVSDLLAAGASPEELAATDNPPTDGQPPALSIEVRPRRFLRLLGRGGEKEADSEAMQ